MKPVVVVVGLGPAGTNLMHADAIEQMHSGAAVFLRTRQHPAAEGFPDATSFDNIYDEASSFDEVYSRIVEQLVGRATADRRVVYAVPGSPLVAERAVAMLRNDERITIEVVPGLSFLDMAWERLGIDPLDIGVRLVNAHSFATEAAGERGPLLVAQCDSPWVLSDVKLAYEENEPSEAVVLQRLGMPDEVVRTVSWQSIDRIEADIFTTLWIPEVPRPVGADLVGLDEVARRLRKACPWDRDQTHDSLAKSLIEESYELVDAIETLEDRDGDDHLIEELGDVLFQVFAHSAIAAEEGRFTVADVAGEATRKFVERHPHVYGDVVAETADDVMATWETNKLAAKKRASVMEGIPSHLPALALATKVLNRAERAGFDVERYLSEPATSGDRLFVFADEIRRAGLDPETELRKAARALLDAYEARPPAGS